MSRATVSFDAAAAAQCSREHCPPLRVIDFSNCGTTPWWQHSSISRQLNEQMMVNGFCIVRVAAEDAECLRQSHVQAMAFFRYYQGGNALNEAAQGQSGSSGGIDDDDADGAPDSRLRRVVDGHLLGFNSVSAAKNLFRVFARGNNFSDQQPWPTGHPPPAPAANCARRRRSRRCKSHCTGGGNANRTGLSSTVSGGASFDSSAFRNAVLASAALLHKITSACLATVLTTAGVHRLPGVASWKRCVVGKRRGSQQRTAALKPVVGAPKRQRPAPPLGNSATTCSCSSTQEAVAVTGENSEPQRRRQGGDTPTNQYMYQQHRTHQPLCRMHHHHHHDWSAPSTSAARSSDGKDNHDNVHSPPVSASFPGDGCPFDLFYYHNSPSAAETPNCTPHVDRGLLSAIVVSPVAGLQLRTHLDRVHVQHHEHTTSLSARSNASDGGGGGGLSLIHI